MLAVAGPTLSTNTPECIPAEKAHDWCSFTSNASFIWTPLRSWILPSYFWLHWSDRTVSQSTQWCAVLLLGYYTDSHRVRSYHSLEKKKLTWSVLGERRDDSFFALERWESCRGWLAAWVFINCTEAFQAVFSEWAPFLLISIWQEAIQVQRKNLKALFQLNAHRMIHGKANTVSVDSKRPHLQLNGQDVMAAVCRWN